MSLFFVALALTSFDDNQVWLRLTDGTVAIGSLDVEKIEFKTDGGTLKFSIGEFISIKRVNNDHVLTRDNSKITGKLASKKFSLKTGHGILAIDTKDILLIASTSFKSCKSKILFFDDYWDKEDLIVATNDKIKGLKTEGDVIHIQLDGMGESSILKKNRYNFDFPIDITFKVRWTDQSKDHGAAYPALHVILDPPDLDDKWWEKPLGDGGQGSWRDNVQNFVFHFSTRDNWRRLGVCNNLEQPPNMHKFTSKKDEWVEIKLSFSKDKVEAFGNGEKISAMEHDFSTYKTFTYGFGDQTQTLVELDSVMAISR